MTCFLRWKPDTSSSTGLHVGPVAAIHLQHVSLKGLAERQTVRIITAAGKHGTCKGVLAQQTSSSGAQHAVLCSELLQCLSIPCGSSLKPNELQLLAHPSPLQVSVFVPFAGYFSDEIVDCCFKRPCKHIQPVRPNRLLSSQAILSHTSL